MIALSEHIMALIRRRDEHLREAAKIDDTIREFTGCPDGWELTSESPLAGAVALHGPTCDHDRDEEDMATIVISAAGQYAAQFLIVDHSEIHHSERGPSVDPGAVRAAMAIYDERLAGRQARRSGLYDPVSVAQLRREILRITECEGQPIEKLRAIRRGLDQGFKREAE